MQGNRGGRDPSFDFGDPFASFGGLGGFGRGRSLMSSFLGGRDPFDDPFFSDPFGGMFGSSLFGPSGRPFMNGHASGFLEHQAPQSSRSRGPIIEEMNSDDEKGEKMDKKDNPRKHGRSSNEPYVQEPDEEEEGRKRKQMQYMTGFNRVTNSPSLPQVHSFSFQSSTVTYGGANGAYYTSSRTKRTGSDGLTIDEIKEADSASRQATHRIARGIHDKGHSVTRKLNSDGRVDTVQTLHNLNEDELVGFEDVWKGNARKHLPGWSEGCNVLEATGSGSNALNGSATRRGWALPSSECSPHTGNTTSDISDGAGSSRPHHRGGFRADVGGRTSSHRSKADFTGPSNMDRTWGR